jgi:hypothetical protein
MGNMTVHWDGDVILFVTNGSGNVIDFKAGLDGDITPRDVDFTGLSVYDRDAAGVIVETSNATGTTGFSPIDPSTVAGSGAGGTANYRGAVVQLQYVRSDGFLAVGVEIYGVRAYDPNVAVWTTPDAYEGDVHDPATQQRYMWNHGNAYDYSDPSGYRWNSALQKQPISLMIKYMRANSQTFNSIFNALADSKRTYDIGFASKDSTGAEHGGFFLVPTRTTGWIALHPFGPTESGGDSDLSGMVERLAHEIGHAYDHELGYPSQVIEMFFQMGSMTGDINPHNAESATEWYASLIHDRIMSELRDNGYDSDRFTGIHNFEAIRY